MRRWILSLLSGYVIVDEDGWGRQINPLRNFARDLDSEKDKDLIDRVKREGKECVGPSNSSMESIPCRKEETPIDKPKPVLQIRTEVQQKLF